MNDTLPKVPSHFTDLSQAASLLNTPFNVIGVCVDYLPSCKTSGSDYTIKFTLHDPSWFNGKGVEFRFFHKDETKLPKITQNGDVLILRNVKAIEVKGQRGQVQRVSSFNSAWTVLHRSSLESSACPRGSDIKYTKSSLASIDTEVLIYARAIWELESSSGFAAPSHTTSFPIKSTITGHSGQPNRKASKFSLVRDLDTPASDAHRVFADLLGEVRKIFSTDLRVELQLTDYTAHHMLYKYSPGCDENRIEGDEYGYLSDRKRQWPGPWGQMTIQIVLWDAHASFALNNVKEGAYVFLRNVQLRLDRDGNKLEGHCRGDRMYPDKVNVAILMPKDAQSDPRFSSLLLRKRDYEIRAKNLRHHFLRDASKPKRPAGEVEDTHEQASSKKTRQRGKQKKKNQEASEDVQQRGNVLTKSSTLDSNTHVECQNIAVGEKQISEILDASSLSRKTPSGNAFDLPYQNCRYKSKLRVVDFCPDDIADFSVPRWSSEYDVLSDIDGSGLDSEVDLTQQVDSDVSWQWRFVLLVEDAHQATVKAGAPEPVQMELVVADTDAAYLLAMDACDLRRHPQQLQTLRNKLFVLWGDLEENKRLVKSQEKVEHPRYSNKAFTCFIKEYGVTKRSNMQENLGPEEHERMFRLWGARIK